MDIFLCGPDEVQFDEPCPHPDVIDGICCTCEHKVVPSDDHA